MDEMEQKLQQLQKRYSTALGIALILLVACVVTFAVAGPYGIIVALLAAGAFYLTVRAQKTCTAFYKENVVRNLTLDNCTFLNDVTFTPEQGIDEDTVYGTGMVRVGDRFESNDLITGDYKGVRFRQSDVNITEIHHDSDNGSSETTLFQGRWMIFSFNKEFRCDLQVYSKFFLAGKNKGGLLFHADRRLSRLKLENEEFNRVFRVYTGDEQEAFYILTPHMMEALIGLKAKVKSQIMLLFVDGSLHVAVDNHKDAFEVQPFRKIDIQAEKQRVLDDIRLITDFVDGMMLDRNVYKQ